MKIAFLIFCFLFFIPYFLLSQNIGIGTTTPSSSAMLDVQSNNKGMLVPRIALTALNTASPVSSPADALLIYNTATAGLGDNAVVPGFYYWSATGSRWNAMKESSSDGHAGFGPWGDCSMNAVSDYNPLVDETGDFDDQFGFSVSISGDYAIAGAYFDNVGVISRQGSATISRYNGSKWVSMQKITDPAGADNDWFGHSVSISGNYAIVGTPRGDVGANPEQGSASIYQFNGTNWVFMQKITEPGGIANDWFGYSVSISGNYAIAGIYRDDVGAGLNQGSVCVYQFNGTGWVFMQKIVDATGVPGDYFGREVSISGNYIIAGAFADDVGVNTDQGSAGIYTYNGSSWVLMKKITDGSGASNDYFGTSVSISGNYAIVGASFDDVGSNVDQGSVLFFRYTGTDWVQMQKISDASAVASDFFGGSVSISGDYALVGWSADDVGQNGVQGSAIIYQRVGLGWQKLQHLFDPGGQAGANFGNSVSIDGTGRRFLVGVVGYANESGKIVFGKIN